MAAGPGGPGGARPGAGRPRRSEKWARPIAAAEKKIADKLPRLIDLMLELSQGVTVEEQTPDGPRVYQEPPDRRACEYLINRIMGMPQQHHQHDIDTEIGQLLAELAAPG